MTKTFFIACILIGAAAPDAYSQKSKVNAAYNFYKEPYQQYDKAKEAIDEAVLNEQTSGSDKAWYYRGLIYLKLYKNDTFGNLCDKCLQTSYESFSKSLALNPKSDFALEIKAILIPQLLAKIFSEGVEHYNTGRYDQALLAFEEILKMDPNDTSTVRNSAYAAEKAGNVVKAKSYYEKLLEMGVRDPDFYISLSNLYKNSNDQAKALEIIHNGRQLYPDTLLLIYNEINLLLSLNRNEEVSEVINNAITKDPNNESLYLVLGNTYDNLANPKDANGNPLPKPALSADYMTKAIGVYKRGLAVNPNNYGLNFNIGAYFFNQAAEMTNAANNIKSEKEYDAARTKANNKFREAQPYLEKALETNPKSNQDDVSIYESTVSSLKELYARTNQTDKYNNLNK